MNFLNVSMTGLLNLMVLSILIQCFQCYQKFKVTMPGVQPKKKESYLCTYKKLPSDASYAYKFKPLADEKTAHHMLVYACKKPLHFKEYWDCTDSSPCRSGERIIYAWAKNASALELPKHVGVALGMENMAPYIVTQIHYARPLQDFEADNSGVLMHLTYNIPRFFSSIYELFGDDFEIPPETVGFHVDVACRYHGPSIKPFAFRTHAHSHGRSISGYRIRDGEWIMIGIGDPQKPQAFYNIEKENRLLIRDGDIIAARCTYDSLGSSSSISVGAFSGDEMCNFYMMYYALNTDEDENVSDGCSHITHKLEFPDDAELPFKQTSLSLPTKEPRKESTIVSPDRPSVDSKKQPATSLVNISAKPTTTVVTKTGPISIATKINKPHHLKQYTPVLDKGWKIKEDIKSRLGEITSIDVKAEDESIVVLHRANRKLKFESFDEENYFVGARTPIAQDTILMFNMKNKSLLHSYGKNMFYLPGGMTIDKEGMFWVTDLGMHQVFKFSPKNFSSPLLALGRKGVPGSDMDHFCGPFDVVLDENQNIFVADGYCNRRIIKFNTLGKPVAQFGNNGILRRPHSLSIDIKHHMLHVLDQGTGTIHVFDTDGVHMKELKQEGSNVNRLTAMAFSSQNEGLLFTSDDKDNGHVISAKSGDSLTNWKTAQGKGVVSGLAVSKDDTKLFVVLKHPSSICKYDIYKANARLISFPWAEITTRKPVPKTADTNQDAVLNQTLDSDNDIEDVTVVPAVIVVAVLATPLLLVLVAALMQRMRMRRKVKKAANQRQLRPLHNKRSVCCCCAPSRYYYGNTKDFDKLVRGSTDESTGDEEEEDLFTRKA